MNRNLKDFINEIEQTGIADIESELDAEMSKSSGERDLRRIRELIDVLEELRGAPNETAARRRIVSEVTAEIPAIRHRKIKRFTAVAACLAVAFVGADLTSHRVLGQGVLPAGYHAVMGGIITYLDGSDGTPDPHVNIYYDTMKEMLDEYGLDVMIPTYIPKGFELEQVVEENTVVIFCFINDQKRVNIAYHQINDLNRVGSFGLPTDTREVYETDVNGHQFYTIKEDQQLKAWCIERESITQLDTYGLPYAMADDILYSLEAV
jgi:hypothetical protein